LISAPPAWTVIPEIGMLELVHPSGRGAGVIEYRERVRPLARMGAIVRRVLALDPLFAEADVPADAERMRTSEGEHAALVTVRVASAQRDVGVVFGDDFYALAIGLCREPALFAEATRVMRELVVGDRHMLATRRRRFDYEPPPGWQPFVAGFVTAWYPPEFPNDSTYVTVYPANPTTLAPNAIFDIMLAAATRGGMRVTKVEPPRPARSDSGLSGRSFEALLRGPPPEPIDLPMACSVLADARYVYAVEASARNVVHLATHRAALDALVASIRPVPASRADIRDATTISHWAE
jgi:hypothetical protein